MTASYNKKMAFLFLAAIVSSLSWGAAWSQPATAMAALFGWVGTVFLVFIALADQRQYRWAYLSGLIVNAIGFYWLISTIRGFGGYQLSPALAVFSLFLLFSSLQYLIFVFISRRLPGQFGKFALTTPVAWVISELISIRIFPWHAGHTQLAFRQLAQIADIGGSLLISFMLFWCSEALVRLLLKKQHSLRLAVPLCCLGACLIYGQMKIGQLSRPGTDKINIALVQANISTAEKHNVKYFERNTERYIELTQQLVKENPKKHFLAIWPESVIVDWIHDQVAQAENDRRIPRFGGNVSLLAGALTYDSERKMYNSALAVLADGAVPEPYHKQILIPFGEYMPFSETFPIIKKFNPSAADSFSAGRKMKIFSFALPDRNGRARTVKIAALICYEDVVQSLASQAVLAGAEVLVNLTNDAWFGNTVAPYQHNLIASFRAIETRRFLVRSTNSGLTAVIDPLGQTVSQLPVFSEDTLFQEISPLQQLTIYAAVGNTPFWGLALLVLVVIVSRSKLADRRRKVVIL